VEKPLVVTVSAWPSNSEGLRRLAFQANVQGLITKMVKVELSGLPYNKLTVTDERACVATSEGTVS
jgi:hypothetical protein